MSLQSSPIRQSITAGAFLFDMDGTLVDSHASIEAVWFEFAQRHDVDRSIVAEALPGRLAADIVLRVLGPAADVRSELQWIRERERRSVVPVQPIAGAARFLASVPPERWAVVTSATRSMMVRRLTATGLPAPRIAVAAEDVTVGKPAPEGFLSAAAQLGASIESCIVFEDSSAGMAAAANAGMRCIIIGDEPGQNIARVDNFDSLRVEMRDRSLVIDLHPAKDVHPVIDAVPVR